MPVVPIARSAKVPIRATLIVVMALVAVLTGILRHWNAGMTTTELLTLMGLVGGGVGLDTVRPSGMVKPTPTPASAPEVASAP